MNVDEEDDTGARGNFVDTRWQLQMSRFTCCSIKSREESGALCVECKASPLDVRAHIQKQLHVVKLRGESDCILNKAVVY
jgi:hypothetical protein